MLCRSHWKSAQLSRLKVLYKFYRIGFCLHVLWEPQIGMSLSFLEPRSLNIRTGEWKWTKRLIGLKGMGEQKCFHSLVSLYPLHSFSKFVEVKQLRVSSPCSPGSGDCLPVRLQWSVVSSRPAFLQHVSNDSYMRRGNYSAAGCRSK